MQKMHIKMIKSYGEGHAQTQLDSRQHAKVVAMCLDSSMCNTTLSTLLEFQELRR